MGRISSGKLLCRKTYFRETLFVQGQVFVAMDKYCLRGNKFSEAIIPIEPAFEEHILGEDLERKVSGILRNVF